MRKAIMSLSIVAAFSVAALDSSYLIQIPVKGVSKYDKDGFDHNGVNKDTGEIYDQNGNLKDGSRYYDENGFDIHGIHRDTGKLYDPEGNMKDGSRYYDSDGFDITGIHKDTGTKYGPDGYDAAGYDAAGYDANGLDRNGVGRTECPSYNGPYWYGTNTSNIPGPDYYAMNINKYNQWDNQYQTQIVWNGVVIASGTGYRLNYSPYTRVEAPREFIVNGYRYFFSTQHGTWSFSSEYISHHVCRTKI